jgi:periplasmic protein CpxP/Spy
MMPPPGDDRSEPMHRAMFPPGLPPGLPFADDAPVPPFLHDVTLSEAQQDKIFSIVHDAAPLLREQGKLAHKSAEAMHELETSGQYDETRLKLLADSNARAMAEIMMIHVRNTHQILALLTPDQRAQVDARKAEMQAAMQAKPEVPHESGNK